jgi:hypothetical protein
LSPRWTLLHKESTVRITLYRHQYEKACEIANSLGCDVTPGINGSCLTVQAFWNQGWPHDDARIRQCVDELERAGIYVTGKLRP